MKRKKKKKVAGEPAPSSSQNVRSKRLERRNYILEMKISDINPDF